VSLLDKTGCQVSVPAVGNDPSSKTALPDLTMLPYITTISTRAASSSVASLARSSPLTRDTSEHQSSSSGLSSGLSSSGSSIVSRLENKFPKRPPLDFGTGT